MTRLPRRGLALVAISLLTSAATAYAECAWVFLARSEWSANPRKFATASIGMGDERSLRAGADPKAGLGFGEGHSHGRDG